MCVVHVIQLLMIIALDYEENPRNIKTQMGEAHAAWNAIKNEWENGEKGDWSEQNIKRWSAKRINKSGLSGNLIRFCLFKVIVIFAATAGLRLIVR